MGDAFYIPQTSREEYFELNLTSTHTKTKRETIYEGWNFNSGNYLFTTDIK